MMLMNTLKLKFLCKLNCVLSINKGWKQSQDINNILCGVSSNIDYHWFDLAKPLV